MAHIQGFDCHQTLLLPNSVDEYIGPDNPVRFVDAFVEQMNLQAAGFCRVCGLDALQQVEANFQGRRFLFRSQLSEHASKAVRAAGVAIPPTLRELSR